MNLICLIYDITTIQNIIIKYISFFY
jgi:hypothetical protein